MNEVVAVERLVVRLPPNGVRSLAPACVGRRLATGLPVRLDDERGDIVAESERIGTGTSGMPFFLCGVARCAVEENVAV